MCACVRFICGGFALGPASPFFCDERKIVLLVFLISSRGRFSLLLLFLLPLLLLLILLLMAKRRRGRKEKLKGVREQKEHREL